VYNDISYYGSDEEKDMLTFMMLDNQGNYEVSFREYEMFWKRFMYMYGEILHVNMSYTTESEQLTKETFNYITNIRCREGD
jgi:hypothetical protein